MTAGFDSPLPPARSGVAEYSAQLLPALRARMPVVLPPQRAGRWIYQLGNNALHRDVYFRALETPGLAVLHDAVLMHFFLGQLTEDAFVHEFVFNYGAWHADLAHDLWRRRAVSAVAPEYFQYPMLKRIAERSRAVAVTNPAAAEMVRRHAPAARVFEIPLFFTPPVVSPNARFAFPPGGFVIGLLGHLRESKRVLPVLRAFHRLCALRANITLAVAGEFVSTDLERAAEPLLVHPAIRRFPHLATPDFNALAEAIDCGINLRFPSAGESSGINIHLMGIGKPLLITESPETARLPEGVCLRVPATAAEEDAIIESLLFLIGDGAAARRIGAHAAAYIAAHHALDRVADLYLEALGS